MTTSRSVPTSVRLTVELKERLDALVEVTGMPQTKLVTIAVTNLLSSPTVSRLLTMSREDLLQHQLANIRAGKHENDGLDLRSY